LGVLLVGTTGASTDAAGADVIAVGAEGKAGIAGAVGTAGTADLLSALGDDTTDAKGDADAEDLLSTLGGDIADAKGNAGTGAAILSAMDLTGDGINDCDNMGLRPVTTALA